MKEKNEESIETKGIVIRPTSRQNYWTVNMPDEETKGRKEQYGGVSTPKLQSFIFHVGQGKSIKRASKLAGFK